MKESQNIAKDTIEITKPVEQRKTIGLVGSLRKKPNLIVFEASLITGDIVRATMELVVDSNFKQYHKVMVKENHIYCYALNGKNAVRKFEKMLNNGRRR